MDDLGHLAGLGRERERGMQLLGVTDAGHEIASSRLLAAVTATSCHCWVEQQQRPGNEFQLRLGKDEHLMGPKAASVCNHESNGAGFESQCKRQQVFAGKGKEGQVGAAGLAAGRKQYKGTPKWMRFEANSSRDQS